MISQGSPFTMLWEDEDGMFYAIATGTGKNYSVFIKTIKNRHIVLAMDDTDVIGIYFSLGTNSDIDYYEFKNLIYTIMTELDPDIKYFNKPYHIADVVSMNNQIISKEINDLIKELNISVGFEDIVSIMYYEGGVYVS